MLITFVFYFAIVQYFRTGLGHRNRVIVLLKKFIFLQTISQLLYIPSWVCRKQPKYSRGQLLPNEIILGMGRGYIYSSNNCMMSAMLPYSCWQRHPYLLQSSHGSELIHVIYIAGSCFFGIISPLILPSSVNNLESCCNTRVYSLRIWRDARREEQNAHISSFRQDSNYTGSSAVVKEKHNFSDRTWF